VKRSLSLVASIALLVVAAGPTGASAQRPSAAAPIQDNVASQARCSDIVPTNRWAGRDFATPSGGQGVKATTQIGGGFHDCYNDPGTDGSGGPAMWVAAEATSSTCTSGCTLANAILQVGITECHSIDSACDTTGHTGDGRRHFFFADGGCGSYHPLLTNIDSYMGGPPTSITNSFNIIFNTTVGVFEIWVNGAQRFTVSDTSAAISCWANHNGTANGFAGNRVAWFGETLDGGDSFGIPLGSYFSSMAYYNSSHAWQLISISGCTIQYGFDGHAGPGSNPPACTVSGGHTLYASSTYDGADVP
jgi:hypothetical protein